MSDNRFSKRELEILIDKFASKVNRARPNTPNHVIEGLYRQYGELQREYELRFGRRYEIKDNK